MLFHTNYGLGNNKIYRIVLFAHRKVGWYTQFMSCIGGFKYGTTTSVGDLIRNQQFKDYLMEAVTLQE